MRGSVNIVGVAISSIFLAAFIPYIGFSWLQSDTQPWAVILAVVIGTLVTAKMRALNIPRVFLLFLWACLYATFSFVMVVVFASGESVNQGLRSLVGLWSAPLIAAAVISLRTLSLRRIFLLVFGLWFVVGVLQAVFPGEVQLAFLVRSSTGGGRGVTSLAPEPAWYARAQIMFMLSATLLFFAGELRKSTAIAVNVLGAFQIVALSLSGLGFVYLSVYAAVFGLVFAGRNVRLISIGASLALLATVLVVGNYLAPDKRVFYLARLTATNPEALWQFAGFRSRVSNPVFSGYVGIVHTKGLGVGVGAPGEPANLPGWVHRFQVIDDENPSIGGRVKGGFPGIIYELGVVGLVWICGFYGLLLFARRRTRVEFRRVVDFSALVLTAVLLVESTIANPMIGFTLGLTVNCALMHSPTDNARDTAVRSGSFRRLGLLRSQR